MNNPTSRRGFFRSFKAAAAGVIGAGVVTAARETEALAQAPGSLPFSPPPTSSSGIPFVNPNKVLLWENTRKEIRESLSSGRLKAAILPTGSIEQHNEHLALVADISNSTFIAQQVALRLYPQVIVAPPSPCGYAPYHMARKGTITLRKETFQAYIFDVMSSLIAHGVRTILVLNGHGGNHQPLQDFLPEWRKKLGITLEVDSYWSGIPKNYMQKIMTAKKPTSHAGEFETSIFQAYCPSRVRSFTMEEYDAAKLNYESDFSPEVEEFLSRDPRTSIPKNLKGISGNAQDRARQKEALLATAEKGEAFISKATQSFTERLQQMIDATEAGRPWPTG